MKQNRGLQSVHIAKFAEQRLNGGTKMLHFNGDLQPQTDDTESQARVPSSSKNAARQHSSATLDRWENDASSIDKPRCKAAKMQCCPIKKIRRPTPDVCEL